MTTVSLVELAWELHKVGVAPGDIAVKVGKHRATVYRWLHGIRLYGIRRYLERYRHAKKGRRQRRKTDPILKDRIYRIREEFRGCCGEKIRYWMLKRYGISPGVSTIYRILGERYQLRSKWKKNEAMVDICTREGWAVLMPALDSAAGALALEAQMAFFGSADLIQRDGGPELKAEWEVTAKRYAQRIRTARPYKKNEQAFIESFNRTLRKECLGWAKYRRAELPVL